MFSGSLQDLSDGLEEPEGSTGKKRLELNLLKGINYLLVMIQKQILII